MSNDTITLELVIGGVNKIAAGFSQVSAAVNAGASKNAAAAAAVTSAAAKVAAVTASKSGQAFGPSAGLKIIAQQQAQAAKAAAMAASQLPGAQGPATRLAQTYSALQQANASGTAQQQFNARYAYAQAQTQFANAANKINPQPKTFQDKLTDALMTSRIGTHAGLMPLINRIVPLIGKAATLFAVGATAAAAALDTLYQGTSKAAQRLTEFAEGGLISGARGDEQSRLEVLGGAIGIAGNQMSAIARQIQASVNAGGPGAVGGAQAGIGMSGGPFGRVDAAAAALREINFLMREDVSLEQKERQARLVGAEDLLKFAYVSRDVAADLKSDFGVNQRIMDKSFRSAIDFQAQTSRAAEAAERLAVVIFSPLIEATTALAKHFADFANWIADKLNYLKPPERGDEQTGIAIGRFTYNKDIREGKSKLRAFIDAWEDKELYVGDKRNVPKGFEGSAEQKQLNATNANTAATEALNHTIKAAGLYGNAGPRGRGAIPNMWRNNPQIRGFGEPARMGYFGSGN
jgi:hypothetical protein